MHRKQEYSSVTLILADWDTHRKSGLTKELDVFRRSTLVMFNGGEEVARVIAESSTGSIEEMFKAAFS